jgi:hypothetical protein
MNSVSMLFEESLYISMCLNFKEWFVLLYCFFYVMYFLGSCMFIIFPILSMSCISIFHFETK